MKKFVALLLAALLVLSAVSAFADKITIAVPNDATNEGRALMLLQDAGVLKLKEGTGLKATKDDIEAFLSVDEIEFYEVEAAMVPSVKDDVDYAIINGNYALDAQIDPATTLLREKAVDNPYVNVVCVNAGNENTDLAKALAAAVLSQQVADYINENYAGAVVSAVAEPTDGYDATVDYDALNGQTIVIACSPTPHAQILAIAKDILAAKGITLQIVELPDYVTPNTAVNDGEAFANYFAHIPYQEDFNAENGTNLVSIAGVHAEPLGLYGGKQADLTALGVAAE
ncbi:MAG: hypothetical protein IKH77_01305 [Clostridia bacterium]|nr:hypothetical protein [Clostridia bacterium]